MKYPGMTQLNHILWLVILTTILLTPFTQTTHAGVPEPGYTMYGVIRNDLDGANVRLTSGTLRWTIRPSGGTPVIFETVLTNINDQYSYVLDVPLESPVSGMVASDGTLQLMETAVEYDRQTVYIDWNPVSFVSPTSGTFLLSQTDRGRFERVDLQAQISFPDADHDGLPDEWELEHFGSNAANPEDDADNDGVSNKDEYLAGSDPRDAQSQIEFITSEHRPEGGITIRWSSESNRFYGISRSLNLLSDFTPFATELQSTPPVNEFIDSSATGDGPYFYRIHVE